MFSPQKVALNSYNLPDRLVVREKLKTWGTFSIQCNEFQWQIPKIKKLKTYNLLCRNRSPFPLLIGNAFLLKK